MNRESVFSEDQRKAVHVAMGGFAFALPWLSWWEALLLAAAAVLFNLLALPRLSGGRLFRPGERFGRLTSGIVLYPLAVLALLVVSGSRLDIVAAAWGMLAAGDGMATLVGRRLPIAPLPWNTRKSVGGSLAFCLFGGAAGTLLAWWCREQVVPPAYNWYPLVAPILAVIVAAAVETIPVSMDDNISVTGSAAATMWVVSLVSEDLVPVAVHAITSHLPVALLANATVAVLGLAAGTVTRSGAIAGVVLGTTIFAFGGLGGWLLLLLSFGVAVATSRMGLARKEALGIAEARGGRRGAGNAVANTGIAAVAATMSVLTYAHLPALIGFVAALVAGASDTVASEVGKAWGRRTFLVTTARRVAPGTSGAISLEGTAAGLAGAALLAAAAVGLQLVPWWATVPIVAGATGGALVESVLGATLEADGIVNNDILNFLNTAAAVLIAVEVARLL